MATIQDINAGSQYLGNEALGGGYNPYVAIDTRPLEQLATYTFLANRTQYEQKQKEMEANAKRLADLTAYDLTTAIPKDRELIQKGYNELFNFVRDNPTVLDYKNNQKGWMEYNKKKNEFENLLQGGKVRSIMNLAREEEISKATNPLDQKRLREDLDKEIASTNINTPLKHTQLFDVKPVTVEAPPSFKLDVTNQGANFIGTRTYELPDMGSINAQASAKALGFEKVSKDPTTSEYKAQSASGKLEPVESATIVSEVLQNPKYQDAAFKNPDGTLNIDAVIKDNAKNTVLTGVLSSVEQYNNKMDEMVTQIKAGYFQDKLGNPLSFGAGGLKESDYTKIDLTNGLSADELLKVRITGLAKPVTYTTKIDQTNEAIARQNVGIASRHLDETIRHNKETEKLGSEELKNNEAKWKATVTGSTTQVNGAMERAKRIYKDLLKLADKNGVITPEKTRQLNVEQLKYLGIEAPALIDETGTVTQKAGFKPLSFKDDEGTNISHAIQLINGEVRVLSNAEQIEGGRYKGQFDREKSTNLFNIGTNILNEELKNAGTKELNTYMGVDVLNGITQSTQGATTTVSGTETTTQTRKGKDGKVYTSTDGIIWTASDGTIIKLKQ